MITIVNLAYGFPQKDLFNNVSFTLEDGQHCAFIGTSGSGKSTLIRMLMDTERYLYDGTIDKHPECRIGCISQFAEIDGAETITVFDYIAEPFVKLQNDLAEVCVAMESAKKIEPLLKQYQDILDAFAAIDGDNYESNIMKKLNLAELGSKRDLPVTAISGGEFKLVQVIKEMLNAPTLLIMDEPDVFLDFENLGALKNLINSFKGILLVITHNRYLLNHCFNKIIHLENNDIQEFNGTYREYTFSLLAQKIEQQELAAEDEAEMARNEILIERLRDIASSNSESTRGRALKARVKVQERLAANRIKQPFVDLKQPYIRFAEVSVPQGTEENPVPPAIQAKGFSIAFDELLLENVSFDIQPTDKVALIGPNGAGKTTLMRALFQQTDPNLQVSATTKLAYLSQKNEERLTDDNTLIEESFDAGFKTLHAIESHHGRYGFTADFLKQKIASLSGGEKNILQLSLVAASDANFLLLDEPTSHLDTYSQMALEKAIRDFKGGMLIISHDYYTIANCVDYVLLVEDKTIRKMSLRKFRKMIYADHMDQSYLALEEKRREIETKIEIALNDGNFELAKTIIDDLAEIIEQMDRL